MNFSRQYSLIPFNSYAIQAFAHLQQGPDELLHMYLHHASEIVLKIHHTSDMSQISVKDLNHYPAVCGLNCRKLKKKCCGTLECTLEVNGKIASEMSVIFGADDKRAKGYCRAESNAQEASTLNEVKPTKDPGPCFRSSGPHFQNRCTKHRNQPNNKSKSTLST